MNRVGLRRVDWLPIMTLIKQLQEIWNLMYRSDLVIADALQQARSQPLLPAAEHRF